MNCKEILFEILTVISKVENKICPYCHSLLESILGEDNCPNCSKPIYPVDYFTVITSIINEKEGLL